VVSPDGSTKCPEYAPPQNPNETLPDGAMTQANARNAIESLLYTYAERMDAGDFEGVAALFDRGRILDSNGRVLATGREEVKAVYERSTRLYADGTPRTQHMTTNLILSFAEAGRTATARSRFTVMQSLPDFPLQCIITGQYDDEFACDTSGADPKWHFTQRQMKPRLVGDLSRHLTFDLSDT
jgi:3-phenylpropionate/cinnamic acid dioxygenase small subunit